MNRALLFRFFTLLCLASSVPGLTIAADPPFSLPPRSELAKLKSALIKTNKGDIILELFPGEAPWHVANFKYLADKRFYDSLSFHLFYPGYIIQGGSPSKNPDDGPGYNLPAEFNRHKHRTGMLGMARKQDLINPQRKSNGSQFYITLGDAPHMDGAFTLFGRVAEGMDVVSNLRQGDQIKSLVVFVRE